MLKFLVRIPIYLFCFRAGRHLMFLSFLVLLGLVVFNNVGPQRFKMSPIQKHIGDDLVRQAVDRFPWNKDVGSVMMVTDSEAWAPFFTDSIRNRVTNYSPDGGRKFDIVPDDLGDRLRKTLGCKTTHSALSESDIRSTCSKMDADTLLLVRCGAGDYVEDAKGASGRLSCRFYSKTGAVKASVDVSSTYQKHARLLGGLRQFFERMNAVELAVWIVVGIALFPFAVSPLTLFVLRRRSVRANAFMVAGYSLVLFLLAWLVLPTPTDAFDGFVWCFCGFAVVCYLLVVCDLLATPLLRQRTRST